MDGKIYAIKSYQTNNIYIGSTKQPHLSTRLYEHITSYKSYLNYKHCFLTSFEIIKFGDAYIELVEQFKYETREQIFQREGHHIRNTLNCVNKMIMGRTAQQWMIDTQESIKQNYINNHEAIEQEKKEFTQKSLNIPEEQLHIYAELLSNPLKLEEHFNYVKLMQNLDSINHKCLILLNAPSAISSTYKKIYLLRTIETNNKIDFLDVSSDAKTFNITDDEYSSITKLFRTTKTKPKDAREFKKLYIALIKNIASLDIITSVTNNTKARRKLIDYNLNIETLKYHLNLHRFSNPNFINIEPKIKELVNTATQLTIEHDLFNDKGN